MQSYQTERSNYKRNKTDNETSLVEKIKSCFLLMKHKKVHFLKWEQKHSTQEIRHLNN